MKYLRQFQGAYSRRRGNIKSGRWSIISLMSQQAMVAFEAVKAQEAGKQKERRVPGGGSNKYLELGNDASIAPIGS